MLMLMRIQISLTDSEGYTEMHPIDVEAEMPEMGNRIIDDVEQAVLALNKEAIRAAIVGYLEALSKKKSREAAGTDGGTLTPNARLYTVDSELGRFSFPTHAIMCQGRVLWDTAQQTFAPLGPREYYHTQGMNTLLGQMVRDMPYRHAVALLNRVRHTVADQGTPVTTAAAMVEREGTADLTPLGEMVPRRVYPGGLHPRRMSQWTRTVLRIAGGSRPASARHRGGSGHRI